MCINMKITRHEKEQRKEHPSEQGVTINMLSKESLQGIDVAQQGRGVGTWAEKRQENAKFWTAKFFLFVLFISLNAFLH
jgi:hypothetical protein